MPNIYPAWAKRKSGGVGKVVHSPRGMLGAEALKIWWILQRSALSAADCLHATAISEYEEIRAVGLRNPVAVIPNGIDLAKLACEPRPKGCAYTALSLGRVHPKKGLDRLIRAWAIVETSFPDWRLRIVGPAEGGHDQELRGLADSLGARNISIEGPVFGPYKLHLYRSADVFVLPTLNENFAMTVAEALAAEVPVISTKGAPWAGLDRERCGWWIDHGVEPMAAALRVAMSYPRSELQAMGARGRQWMARDFGWDRVAEEMLEVYRWLKDGGRPPATVQMN
jgi:glycosyltransferase involved in cell wall biosynthesis